MKPKQLMFKVRRTRDGKWAKKGNSYVPLEWVIEEHRATFWKSLGNLKQAVTDGSLREEKRDGVPLSGFIVHEYEVLVSPTNRHTRLSDIDALKISKKG